MLGRGLSSVAVGLVLALAVAGALLVVVRWAGEQASRMPSRVAEGVTVAAYRVGSDLVVVNYGYRQYTARLVNEDGSPCGSPQSVQPQPRSSLVVTTSCSVGWLLVEGSLVRVVRVGG